jgi:hypothetical protein
MVPLFEKKESPRLTLSRLSAQRSDALGDRAARWLLATSWSTFVGLIAGFYLLTGMLLAKGFQLSGGLHQSQSASFADAFAVSLQALTVFGSGRLIALTPVAKGLAAGAMFVGWLALLIILAMTMVRFMRLRPHFRTASLHLEAVAEAEEEAATEIEIPPPARHHAPN